MDDLAKLFPAEVTRGIRMHRAVDAFTDGHPAFKSSRLLLAPDRRRFAGIIIDLIFDHFLSVHWQRYHNVPLEEFCQQIYRELESHPEWQAGRLSQITPIMKRENWLMRYSTMEGMELTLSEVSQRSPRISKMSDGIIDLRQNYGALESQFNVFMPEVFAFVEEWKKAR